MESQAARKEERGTKLQYILTGFDQTAGIRIYTFEGTGDGRRIDYTVEVDLTLIPGYGIRIQELPLLCRELLERRVGPDEMNALTFTEEAMRNHAERLATARELAEKRKKPGRRPVNPNAGAAWRAHLL